MYKRPAEFPAYTYLCKALSFVEKKEHTMVKQTILKVLFIILTFSSTALSQSCIRQEVLAALEELENRSPTIVLSGNQSACLPITEMEELNSTIQGGFKKLQRAQQSIKDEMQQIQHETKEEMQEIKGEIEKLEEKLQNIQNLLSTSLNLHLMQGLSPSNPALSCEEIQNRNSSVTSGYYWLYSSSEEVTRVYCDMERTCGGVHGGWMKVVSINMTNSSDSCPSGLRTLTSPKRLCAINIDGAGCSSAYLNVHGVQYRRVCGKIIGYQQKTTDAFAPYHFNQALTIDNTYVDGISLTHGQSPRKHIWTFAAALHEATSHPYHVCPCTNVHSNVNAPIPPFVGSDYFCDTGSAQIFEYRFYPNDPLWDGQGCGTLNTCCSFNNPPWFMKQLSASTADNVEIRLCSDQERLNEDVVFETLELYVR